MVFSSSFFLFVFLPITLLISRILPGRFRNSALLFMSLLFYSWGEPTYVLVMLISISINYLIGHKIIGEHGPLFLALGVSANIGCIAYFKYSTFILQSAHEALGIPFIEIGNIHLPIGISFFTFQAISYLVDVYRKETAPQENIVHLALYISLFPQLVAGPIVRYKDINDQLKQRSMTIDSFAYGIERFLIGLIKKVLIANNLAVLSDTIFDESTIDTPLAWLGILAYSFQIYFDFSGYSDMAIGLGRMFGFTFLENFNYPYISKSIKEFWRRWHISLSSWFRDYLYIPLGGNRHGKFRTYFNLIVVFFLTGLWHGASWNFVLWGLFHGFFLILERFLSKKTKIRIPHSILHFYTLLVVAVGWVFFRSENIASAFHYLEIMFAFQIEESFPNNILYLINKEVMWVFVLALIFCIPTKKYLFSFIESLNNSRIKLLGLSLFRLLLIVLGIISLSYIAADTYNPFIYFRF